MKDGAGEAWRERVKGKRDVGIWYSVTGPDRI